MLIGRTRADAANPGTASWRRSALSFRPALRLTTPMTLTLERALAYIQDE